MYSLLSSFLLLAPSVLRVANGQVTDQNPPWEIQVFSFGWNPYNNTMTQCRTLNFTWSLTTTSAATLTAPLFIYFSAPGNVSQYVLNVNTPAVLANPNSGSFSWPVNLPTGGPYMTTFADSAGNTGGSSNFFNILASTTGNSCQITQLSPATLNFTVGNVGTQCGTIPMSVTGGVPPYKLAVLPEDYPPKFVSFSTGFFEYVLDVTAGTNVYFVVTDSSGKSAVASSFSVGSSSDSSCLQLAASVVPAAPQFTTVYPGLSTNPLLGTATASASGSTAAPSSGSPGSGSSNNSGSDHHSSSNIGPIVGGIVGALAVLAVIVALLVWWLCNRRTTERTAGPVHHDIDTPHVDPYIAEPLMATVESPNARASTAYTDFGTPTDAGGTSGRRSSWTASSDSPALLAARRGDAKASSPGLVASDTRRPSPSQTNTSTPSSPGRTQSPGLPPGAAPPNPLGLVTPGATEIPRFKTPPPQYSER